MALREYLLTDEEISSIDKLCKRIKKEEEVYKWVRKSFKAFLHNIGYRLQEHEITRALQSFQPHKTNRDKINKGNYEHRVLLYDFAIDNLYKLIRATENLTPLHNAILQDIMHLRNLHRKRHPIVVPGNYERNEPLVGSSDDLSQPVPKNIFEHEFLGYRRGSDHNEIVAFYINLTVVKGNNKRIEFVNEYKRKLIRWKVTGAGMFVGGILYLWGHAQDTAGSQSLGMRFFALKNIAGTPIVNGVVISMDEREKPIAARVLMIPKASHVFEDDLGEMNNEKFFDTLFDKRSNDYTRQREEIIARIGHVLQGEVSIDDYISNLTTTVLNGEDEPGIFQAEEEFRERCANDSDNPGHVLRVILESYRTNMEAAPPA